METAASSVRLWPWCLVSGSLHAAALVAALWSVRVETGVLDQASEAVSIEAQASWVIEAVAAIVPDATGSATAAPEAVIASDAAESPAASSVEPDPLPAPPIDSVAAIEAPAATIEPQEGKSKQLEQPPSTKTDTENRMRRDTQLANRGSAASSRAKDGNAGSGRASASTGSILGYAARVRAAVAGRKPSVGGLSGTAVISFSVTRGGALGHAGVSRSSGSGALDRLALGAVRGASFPPPPSDATASQLRFSIPFHFR